MHHYTCHAMSTEKLMAGFFFQKEMNSERFLVSKYIYVLVQPSSAVRVSGTAVKT